MPRRPSGFPRHVTIRGERWTVEYPDRPLRLGGDRVLGIAHRNERRIEIAPQPLHEMRETLLHEIRHVYFWDAPVKGVGPKLEEDLCDAFAEAVRDLCQNNPLGWLR